MRPVAHGPSDEEFRIEGDASLGLHVKLHHPAVDAIWIKLRIDRAVERVGKIDPSAIAADLDHLRSAVERPVLAPAGVALEPIPPMRTLPVSFGSNGSETSYCCMSPVP